MSDSLLQLATVGGPVALILAFFVLALMRGWLVPGYLYERERQAKNDLLNAVLQSNEAAKLALETARLRERIEERP